MKVGVIGTGYVGLVTGACLATIGHTVVCMDNNEAKIQRLRQGVMPIYEPGLEELVAAAAAAGRLVFTTEMAETVRPSDVVFITVGTPSRPDGSPDLSAVRAVARAIGSHLDGRFRVIVNKSTVPVGSGNWVRMLVEDGANLAAAQSRSSHHTGNGVAVLAPAEEPNFSVASNPEFLREGSAVWDTFNPDRIVIGAEDVKAIAVMRKLYAYWLAPEQADRELVPMVVTDLASAEMIKYAANAFLATKISFINEIANICERVGADVTRIAEAIGLDKRIGRSFLNAGAGWGGSCFPKDVSALVSTAAEYGHECQLLKATLSVNDHQRQVVIEKLQRELRILKGRTVALWGLAFKPHTDDIRCAPALAVAEHLLNLGCRVVAHDPVVTAHQVQGQLPDLQVAAGAVEAVQGADALLVMTEWPEYTQVNLGVVAAALRQPIVIDARNCLDPQQVVQAGMRYSGIGR
ncbi:UDP-glucose dehydrogenase family protein [Gloeobacter morelensis]|uniref:UDP-glucose 6-dehydrogenase n=1 Tax=Gloeobacter morelensis MG652769 TaxID=2781736 RepID=A0ABY3PJG0_9CYAN|nr:UDP-glucose/GDP-mannose dehydrogenase family protein [Gloeobacter morelensis]UFP93729.1 UDP-glucose/GDP-mannose dehydrogenase family protein [Gloeobacter morelensis MG652769]